MHGIYLDKNNELIEQFKGWFWSLVERMNNKERQDLVSVSVIAYYYKSLILGSCTSGPAHQ